MEKKSDHGQPSKPHTGMIRVRATQGRGLVPTAGMRGSAGHSLGAGGRIGSARRDYWWQVWQAWPLSKCFSGGAPPPPAELWQARHAQAAL